MLNAKQTLFAREYCVDFNATKAYERAGYSAQGAGESGYQLLKNPHVQAFVSAEKRRLAAMVEASANLVLREWLDIATADPRELVDTRVGACRYCYGIDNKWQWTAPEYEEALEIAMLADKEPPPLKGGLGYRKTLPASPTCPGCEGEGVSRVVVADSRTLSVKAARLMAGIKQTKDGIEIKMRDQDAAWAKLADYLGMSNKSRAEIAGPGGGPIQHELLAATPPAELTDEQLMALISANTDNLGVLPGVSPSGVTPNLLEATL